MFTVGMTVKCKDAVGQPRLSEGSDYQIVSVGERGLRVSNSTGEIPYEFAFRRFVPHMPTEVGEDDPIDVTNEDDAVYMGPLRYALLFSRSASSGAYGIAFGFVDAASDDRELGAGTTIKGKQLRIVKRWTAHPDVTKRGVTGLAAAGPAEGSAISAAVDGAISDVIALFWVTKAAKEVIDRTGWQ